VNRLRRDKTHAFDINRRARWLILWGMMLAHLATASSMAAQTVRFAVIGGVPANPAQETPVRALVAAIASHPEIEFILDVGNLKGAQEPCTDILLQDRQALLNSSSLPLMFVPGAHDWVDCQTTAAGRFDPLERLDLLRDLMFSTSDSMGAVSLPLTHESEVSRFRNFHENTEWQQGPVLFVTLNVAGNNNHFVAAGGRNGEFDDRTIANRFWLAHAERSARQRHPTAVVIAIEGDPGLNVQSHRGPFDWLDFRRASPRDGYQEFKQDLLKFAQQYDGPILLINQHEHAANAHGTPAVLQPAFHLGQPLHHKNGSPLGKIWQLELNTQGDPMHWVSIEILPGREAGFRASLQTVPTGLSAQAAETSSNASAVPAPPPQPPVALPVPVLRIPGVSDNDRGRNSTSGSQLGTQ
jgi:hypothetical protein